MKRSTLGALPEAEAHALKHKFEETWPEVRAFHEDQKHKRERDEQLEARLSRLNRHQRRAVIARAKKSARATREKKS